MGVPGLYRYLTEKYPNIVSECVEEIPTVQKTTISSNYDDFEVADGQLPTIKKKTVRIVTQGVDTTKPNPNGKEFDNLYLDMNGIIHPCCHPEDEEAPKTEEEMYEKIFEYVERIYAAIRPRKVLFLAVDGPAPRAKQNQQRARRYKSAKDMEDQKKVERELREELISRGLEPPPEKIDPIVEKPIRILKKKKLSSFKNKELASLLMEDSDMPLNEEFEDNNQEEEEDEYFEIHPAGDNWDSNVITPGTPFMYRLGKALRYFIHMKLTTDEGWKKVKIILSDASVPGEGEHKIMDFIRSQREMKGYNPNTSHVIHGLDADLTMLALATHEPYFYNLREKVNFGKNSGGKGYDVEKKNSGAHLYEYKPLEILHISVLREYLEIELLQETDRLPFLYEFERGLDDFVFICFFVGNDFLPHLPSLDIREGAIDLLLALYKESLPYMGGYLTENGDVNVARVQYLLKQVSGYEDKIFSVREKREEYFKQQQEQRKREQKERKDQSYKPEGVEIVPILKEHRGKFGHITNPYEDFRKKQGLEANTPEKSFLGKRKKEEEENEELEKEAPVEKKIKETDEHLSSEAPSTIDSRASSTSDTIGKMDSKQYEDSLKMRIDESKNVDTQKFPDTVKLGSQGWKERYYKDKMDIMVGTDEYWDVSLKYLEGLVWVFRYYYTGCDSWDWFYPYHFAPFASDMAMVDSSKLGLNFKKGQPYKPFSQLLGVLPPRSSHALPICYRELMLNDESPIINYYPTDFKIDLNGKTKTWMGVCLLPFIDQDELQAAIKTVEPKLSSEEKERNTLGNTTLFVHFEHPLQHSIMSCYLDESSYVDFNRGSKDIAGTFRQDPLSVAPSDMVKVPWKADLLDDVAETAAVSACFDFPLVDKTKCKYIAKLLPNVTLPPRMLPTILDSGSVPVVIGQNGEKTVTFCSSREMIDNIMNGKPRNNYLSFRRNGGGGRHEYNNRERVDFSRSGNFRDRNRDNNYQRNENRNYDNRGDKTYQRNDNRDYQRSDNRDDRNNSYPRNDYRNNSDRNYDNRYNRDYSGDGRGTRNYSERNDNRSDNRNDNRGDTRLDTRVDTRNDRNYGGDNRNDRNYDNNRPSYQNNRRDDTFDRNESYNQRNNNYQKSPYSSNPSNNYNSPYSSAPPANNQSPSPYSASNPYATVTSSPYSQSPYSSTVSAAQQSPYSNTVNSQQPSASPYSQVRQSPYASQQNNYNRNANTPYAPGERRI